MSNTRILLVDDDVQFLEATEYMLKYENYTVITAKNGEDAIIKYKESGMYQGSRTNQSNYTKRSKIN